MKINIKYDYFENFEYELETTNASKSLLNIMVESYKLVREVYPTEKENWDEKRAVGMEAVLKEIMENHGIIAEIKPSCKRKIKEKGKVGFINFHIGFYSYFIVNLMAPDEYFKKNFPYQRIYDDNITGTFSYLIKRKKTTTVTMPEDLRILVKTTEEDGKSLTDAEIFSTYLHEFTHFLNVLEKLYYKMEVNEHLLDKIIKKSFKRGLAKWFNIKYIG